VRLPTARCDGPSGGEVRPQDTEIAIMVVDLLSLFFLSGCSNFSTRVALAAAGGGLRHDTPAEVSQSSKISPPPVSTVVGYALAPVTLTDLQIAKATAMAKSGRVGTQAIFDKMLRVETKRRRKMLVEAMSKQVGNLNGKSSTGRGSSSSSRSKNLPSRLDQEPGHHLFAVLEVLDSRSALVRGGGGAGEEVLVKWAGEAPSWEPRENILLYADFSLDSKVGKTDTDVDHVVKIHVHRATNESLGVKIELRAASTTSSAVVDAVVLTVDRGKPMHKAGVLPGDIIVALGGISFRELTLEVCVQVA